jgi:hypothetical protein
MSFYNEIVTMRGFIIENILTTGIFMKKDECIELSKPYKYNDINITRIEKNGDVTVYDTDQNRVDVNVQDLEIECLARLADHLMNAKNYRIVKY